MFSVVPQLRQKITELAIYLKPKDSLIVNTGWVHSCALAYMSSQSCKTWQFFAWLSSVFYWSLHSSLHSDPICEWMESKGRFAYWIPLSRFSLLYDVEKESRITNRQKVPPAGGKQAQHKSQRISSNIDNIKIYVHYSWLNLSTRQPSVPQLPCWFLLLCHIILDCPL